MQGRTPAAISVPVPEYITPIQLIDRLLRKARSRRYALSFYPYAAGVTERLHTIDEIEHDLLNLRAEVSDRAKVVGCLRLENAFAEICPSGLSKQRNRYMADLTDYMAACRIWLKWRKQS